MRNFRSQCDKFAYDDGDNFKKLTNYELLTERPGADFCLLIADESKSLIWRTNPMQRMSKKTSFAKFDWKQPPAVGAKVSPPRTAKKSLHSTEKYDTIN